MPTPLQILPVIDRRTVRAWARVPAVVYRDDPAWVPALRSDDRADARRSPGGSQTVRYVALCDGHPAGRIACSLHPSLEPLHLAAYEALDDDVAEALFAAATAHARANGRQRLVGPRGSTLLGTPSGLQVDGFDRPPPLGAPHHPRSYQRHWEELGGFHPVGTILSFGADRSTVVYPEWLDDAVARTEADGYRAPVFRRFAEFLPHVEALRQLLNAAMAELPEALDISPDDMPVLLSRLRAVIRPDLARLIFHGDELVGVVATAPEIGAGLRRANGRLLPIGWWWIVRERRRTRTLTFLTVAMRPDHQSKGAVLAAGTMFRDVFPDARWQQLELPLVDATNAQIRQFIEGMFGARPVAEYRVYERPVDV